MPADFFATGLATFAAGFLAAGRAADAFVGFEAFFAGALPLAPDFEGPCFDVAFLPEADFAGADLTGTDLADPDFAGADFAGANFAGADFTGAGFAGAGLPGADFIAVEPAVPGLALAGGAGVAAVFDGLAGVALAEDLLALWATAGMRFG